MAKNTGWSAETIKMMGFGNLLAYFHSFLTMDGVKTVWKSDGQARAKTTLEELNNIIDTL